MKYLTEAEIETIDYAKTSISERVRLPATDVETLLSIITRQNLALEKAMEMLRDTHKVAAEYYETSWGSADEVQFQMNEASEKITAIMNGEVNG